MDYIFTEYFFTVLLTYIDLLYIVEIITTNIFVYISDVLPLFVKLLIGYCHFYYQLGYGLIFYIYIYRRYTAKKKRNLKNFYGNSILNWTFLNLSVFNKFIFNKQFSIFIWASFINAIKIIQYWLYRYINKNNIFSKNLNRVNAFKSVNTSFIWTPIFRRSSYITLVAFLKRFIRKK